MRRTTSRILRAQGYLVLEAGPGPDALTLAADHSKPIDLLLTDVIMPGMSGRQLAEGLATQRPGTPVLYMSGYTTTC